MTGFLRVKVSGGLGNQLFKSLVGFEFARLANKQLVLDLSWYLNSGSKKSLVSNRNFELEYFTNFSKHWEVTTKHKLSFSEKQTSRLYRKLPLFLGTRLGVITDRNYDHIALGPHLRYMDGNFEDWRYLPEDNVVLDLLTFPTETSESYKSALAKIGETKFIGIHVRRGDYVRLPEIYDVLTPRYYIQAIRMLKDKVGDLPTVLFSDDPAEAMTWLNQGTQINIDTVLNFDSNSQPAEIMRLLSLSAGLVCAHSTFSWWSAKIGSIRRSTTDVVMPSRFFRSEQKIKNFLHVPGWEIIQV
jgi:Glycosyl transferase family 11